MKIFPYIEYYDGVFNPAIVFDDNECLYFNDIELAEKVLKIINKKYGNLNPSIQVKISQLYKDHIINFCLNDEETEYKINKLILYS